MNIKIQDKDNVAIALQSLTAGSSVEVGNDQICHMIFRNKFFLYFSISLTTYSPYVLFCLH